MASNSNLSAAAARCMAEQMDPKRCVVLVPYATHIVPACERGLIELQRCGYEVWRVGGYANIDIGRSEIVTAALDAGFEETFWIDADVEFSPDAVQRLRSFRLPIACGIYARKGARAIAAHTLPLTGQLSMGRGSNAPVELLYAATGFLHVRREVYAAIREQLALPLCNAQFGRPMVPYFMPMIVNHDGREQSGDKSPHSKGHWYLADDYSFCERARQCGYKIMADPSIRLWHIGEYAYGWEDAGQDRQRHDSFTFFLNGGKKA
jgi:hypothetical protein